MQATATQVKTRFGEYLDRAQREPVVIEKSGRAVAVLVALEDYQRWQAIEDQIWAERALEARKSGFLGTEQSMEFLLGRLREIDAAEGTEGA